MKNNLRRIEIGIILSFFLFMGHTLLAQSLSFRGYPSREGKIDLRSNFVNPPKGYGNVPFYWWNGDTLKIERLLDQLELLSDAPIDGFSVSYIHTHPSVDVALNAQGYGSFGRADAGIPAFYSAEWWDLWNRFSGECAKRNMGLGVDDYVVGWAKNGFYIDSILQSPDLCDYQGRLHCASYTVEAGDKLNVALPPHTLSVVAYPAGLDLSSCVKGDKLEWSCDGMGCQKVYVISTSASPELHPQYGKRVIDAYFNRFEEELDEQGKKGMNYFFQDELHYDLNIHSWSEDMREEFKKRKGYDVCPFLPALWDDIGDVTPKIRLDYAQVVTELAEERYFKPIFDWHYSRGLIYGCDNNGRGLEPLQYLDYFRAVSWFTAPGNDAPARGSSFRQTKVSSSISHLYKRPRTWLEAFYGMGWDSNGEWLTSQLDHHLIAGGNLLCLHGLYYSTHGGWWEWAPPCFHFRMPYWPHMKRWLKYAERMSFVLSQGVHVCDIAIMYPTEVLQAYPDVNMEQFWQVSEKLSTCGLDYDYLDYQSLQQAEVEGGELHVSDESYKVLILVNMKAMHYETLLKVYDFYKNGGVVMAVGELPQATSRIGKNDARVNAMVKEMFGGKGVYEIEALPNQIGSLITPDFKTQSGEGKVLHRRVAGQDVYMVMNVRKGDEIFFRSKGKVERWTAWDGNIADVPISRQTDKGTWITYDADYNESRLFVFSAGEPEYSEVVHDQSQLIKSISVDGEWDIEIVPTMNNKWGDFRLPATEELIGVEAREFAYGFVPDSLLPVMRGRVLPYKGIYGYAPYMETLTLPSSVSLETFSLDSLNGKVWKPYCYSWEYGVFDNPGSQGYHGLKGKVDNRFLILDQGGHQFFRTYVYAPQDADYRIEQEGTETDYCYLDGKPFSGKNVTMKKGWHQLIQVYADTPVGDYILEEKKSNSIDNRKRSAFVFYPADYPPIKENSSYDTIVAMKWFRTGHLPYSPLGDHKGLWCYEFQTAPGTCKLFMKLNGDIKDVWVDSMRVERTALEKRGEKDWSLDLSRYYTSRLSTVTIAAEPDCANIGPAFFVTPVKMQCKGGKMLAGNWTEYGALKFYSGGIRYAKSFSLPDNMAIDGVFLDLGGVNATCEVVVNGKSAGVLMHPPYVLDVSKLVERGENKIEILVYSTLSNHYQTIPSAYRGTPVSGLLGPVKLLIYGPQSESASIAP